MTHSSTSNNRESNRIEKNRKKRVRVRTSVRRENLYLHDKGILHLCWVYDFSSWGHTMAHAVQKVVQRCEDCEENGGSMGKKFIKSENKKCRSLISNWN